MASLIPSPGASMDGQNEQSWNSLLGQGFCGVHTTDNFLLPPYPWGSRPQMTKVHKALSLQWYLNRRKGGRNAHSLYFGVALLRGEVWSDTWAWEKVCKWQKIWDLFCPFLSQTSSFPASPALALTLTWPVGELVWLPILAYQKKTKRHFLLILCVREEPSCEISPWALQLSKVYSGQVAPYVLQVKSGGTV